MGTEAEVGEERRAKLLAVITEKGATGQEVQVASRSWKTHSLER